MEKISFPSEMEQLAGIERKISEDLTLDKIESIADQIFNLMTEKTKGIALRLLGQLEEKQEKLLSKEIALLNSDQNLFSRIERLKSLLFFLSPEEKSLQIEAIKQIYADLEPQISLAAQREIEFLEFRLAFPIIEDLFGEDPSGLATQIKRMAKKIEKTHSLKSLSDFNETQLQGIYAVGRGA